MQQAVRFFIRDGRVLAIQFLMLATFVLAALAKWEPGTIPAGFIEQFGETWLASLPTLLCLYIVEKEEPVSSPT